MQNPIVHNKPTQVSEIAFDRFLVYIASLKLDGIELSMLIGAVMFNGGIESVDEANGKHFFFTCPNELTFKRLKQSGLLLVICLSKFFNLNRVVISTVDDKCCHKLKPDYYHYNSGVVPLPDGNYLVNAWYEGHTDWYILQIVDEDGFIKS